ncbi:MAG: tetratricopeptide repeat protein, partial [Candidatus Gastranaerophilales bacterium]|nr:tetratricopeptide repeat protein [Candidatus Gastranaerophilales bacterium]
LFLKEYDKGLAYLERALILDKENPNNYINLINYSSALKRYEIAISYTCELLEKFPDIPQKVPLVKNLGLLYFEMTDYEKSIRYFNEVLAINPNDNGVTLTLGFVYLEKGDSENALECFKKLPENDPNTNLGLAAYWTKKKDFSKAVVTLRKSKRLNVEKSAFNYYFGDYLFERGKYLPAEKFILSSLAINPQNHYALYRLGLVYKAIDRHAEAEDNFKKAKEINPYRYENLVEVGNNDE